MGSRDNVRAVPSHGRDNAVSRLFCWIFILAAVGHTIIAADFFLSLWATG